MRNTFPLFIVGTGRSGTTLLRLMFNEHPEIAVPYETHFLPNYINNIGDYGELADKQNMSKLVDALLAEPMIQKWDYVPFKDEVLDAIETPSLAAVIDGLFFCYARAAGKSRWGDKSAYLSKMHLICNLFPNARFIHIIRDGRDVALSSINLKWGSGTRDIVRSAEWWSNHVQTARKVGAALGQSRYCEVRYEDLILNTVAELQRLCEFAEIDYVDDMCSYYKKSNDKIPADRMHQHQNIGKPPDPSRIFAWKKSMSSREVSLFTLYAGEELADVGYEVPLVTWTARRVDFEKSMAMLRKGAIRVLFKR